MLGLSHSPQQHFRILKEMRKEWRTINERALHRAIQKLYDARMVDSKEDSDGAVTLLLTDKGRTRALRYNLETLTVPVMQRWDGKWRIVFFDIPENRKAARDALARILKQAGFHHFQKSVFVHPFECSSELNFLVEFFRIRPFVRFVLAEHIDNELHLKKIFHLM